MMTVIWLFLSTLVYTAVGILTARLLFITKTGFERNGMKNQDKVPATVFGFAWPLAIVFWTFVGVMSALGKVFSFAGRFVFSETPAEKEKRLKEERKDAYALAIMVLAETDPELLSDQEAEQVQNKIKNMIMVEQYNHGRSTEESIRLQGVSREITRRRNTTRIGQ